MSTSFGKFELLRLFKTNTLNFLDSLIEMFPDRSDLITIRLMITDVLPIEDLLIDFAARILPHKSMIEKRNEQFFLAGKHDIFSGANTTQVISWKQIWQSSRLDQEDKLTIWKWIDVFCDLAEQYVISDKKSNKN